MQQAGQHLVRGLLTAALTAFLLVCGPFPATGHAQPPSTTQRGTVQPSRSQAYGVAVLQAPPAAGQHPRLHHPHPPVKSVDAANLPQRTAEPREAPASRSVPWPAQHTTRPGRAPPA